MHAHAPVGASNPARVFSTSRACSPPPEVALPPPAAASAAAAAAATAASVSAGATAGDDTADRGIAYAVTHAVTSTSTSTTAVPDATRPTIGPVTTWTVGAVTSRRPPTSARVNTPSPSRSRASAPAARARTPASSDSITSMREDKMGKRPSVNATALPHTHIRVTCTNRSGA